MKITHAIRSGTIAANKLLLIILLTQNVMPTKKKLASKTKGKSKPKKVKHPFPFKGTQLDKELVMQILVLIAYDAGQKAVGSFFKNPTMDLHEEVHKETVKAIANAARALARIVNPIAFKEEFDMIQKTKELIPVGRKMITQLLEKGKYTELL